MPLFPFLTWVCRVVPIGFAAFLVACNLTDAGVQRYTLQTVNGRALPAPYMPVPGTAFDSVWEVTSGSLMLGPDTTLTYEFVIRCRDGLAPGSCGVSNDGRNSLEGVYSREGEWVRFEGQAVPMSFESNTVVIQFGGQTVFGFVPPQLYEFRRSLW